METNGDLISLHRDIRNATSSLAAWPLHHQTRVPAPIAQSLTTLSCYHSNRHDERCPPKASTISRQPTSSDRCCMKHCCEHR